MDGTPQPLDIAAALKVFAQKLSLPRDSLKIYARLWQLETWLREMVYVELKSAQGPAWRDTLKSVEYAKGKDKNLVHMATPEEPSRVSHAR